MANTLLSSNANYVASTTGGIDPQHGLRRRHNFGDRVYKLTPDETPFFVYLNAVAKMPTNDPVFRVLEDREAIKWTDRTFTTNTVTLGTLDIEAVEGTSWRYSAAGDGSDDSIDIPLVAGQSDELLAGMLVQAVHYASGAEIPTQITARVEAVGSDTIQLKTVSLSGDTDVVLAANADITLQVIGSAFAEGTGAPDSFGYGIDEAFGYTQIFKTSAAMSNTAYATNMRGYAKEWDRIWAMKLREHKVDIERAFLYNNKGIVGGVQYTDGLIGNILSQGGVHQSAPATKLAYASNKSYSRVIDIDSAGDGTVASEFTYDSFHQTLK